MSKRITFASCPSLGTRYGGYRDRKSRVIIELVKRRVMKESKSEVRTKWLHIRLNQTEYGTIHTNWKKTATRELSDYARRVLLKKPVVINHRNQSADEILAEMIRLKSELHAIGNNFNQAVHQLHTLDAIPQIKIWLITNEAVKNSFLQKTEEIKARMIQIYEVWSQK